MERIHVYDDFFSENELNIIDNIIKSKEWKWGHVSNNANEKSIYSSPFWYMDLTNETYFSEHLKNIFEKHFSKNFIIERVYANGQSFGQTGDFHIDNENDNTYTICLYLTKIPKDFQDMAGGYIYFKIPPLIYDIAYAPVYNRVIMFPSNYIHRGGDFNRFVKNLRISVAWKLLEIKNEK